jgi:hypothetical protein
LHLFSNSPGNGAGAGDAITMAIKLAKVTKASVNFMLMMVG